MIHENGMHRWAMSWPGDYCLCCGMDSPIESAMCCSECEFFFPGPEPGWMDKPSIITAEITPDILRQPILCVYHTAWADVKCPCTKEHEGGRGV